MAAVVGVGEIGFEIQKALGLEDQQVISIEFTKIEENADFCVTVCRYVTPAEAEKIVEVIEEAGWVEAETVYRLDGRTLNNDWLDRK